MVTIFSNRPLAIVIPNLIGKHEVFMDAIN